MPLTMSQLLPLTGAVVVCTPTDTHADLIEAFVKAGKAVFCEKPIDLSLARVKTCLEVVRAHKGTLMVGFNRRFSPLIMKMKELLKDKAAPKTFIITINAGEIPKEHWTQDVDIGGGRIVGEACHFIDLCSYLVGSKVIVQ